VDLFCKAKILLGLITASLGFPFFGRQALKQDEPSMRRPSVAPMVSTLPALSVAPTQNAPAAPDEVMVWLKQSLDFVYELPAKDEGETLKKREHW
jgi:hypothetical protein